MKKIITLLITFIFLFDGVSYGLRKPMDFGKGAKSYPGYQVAAGLVSDEDYRLMDPETPETEKNKIRENLWRIIERNLGDKARFPDIAWVIERLRKEPFAYHVDNLTLGIISKARNNLISDERSILRGEFHVAVEDLCRGQKVMTDVGHPGRFEEREAPTNAMLIMREWAYNYTDPKSTVVPFTTNETEITGLELAESMLRSVKLNYGAAIIDKLIRTPAIYRISIDAILISWARGKISVYRGSNKMVSHVLVLGELPVSGVEYCLLPGRETDSEILLKLLRNTSNWRRVADISLEDPMGTESRTSGRRALSSQETMTDNTETHAGKDDRGNTWLVYWDWNDIDAGGNINCSLISRTGSIEKKSPEEFRRAKIKNPALRELQILLTYMSVVYSFDERESVREAISGIFGPDNSYPVPLEIVRGEDVLDLATGRGVVLELLLEKIDSLTKIGALKDRSFPASVVGVDLAEEMLKGAREKLAPYKDKVDISLKEASIFPEGLRYVPRLGDVLKNNDGTRKKFKIIVISNAFHFFTEEETESTLLNATGFLKEGGYLVIVYDAETEGKIKDFTPRDYEKFLKRCGLNNIRHYNIPIETSDGPGELIIVKSEKITGETSAIKRFFQFLKKPVTRNSI
ncbi:MAG: class I SAM-dependent methyltransferase [Candidatus Omnitrophota bacterium]|nr:class I SAM-dependent methyltransferase [Candidatus Omnitrophota bacterium]